MSFTSAMSGLACVDSVRFEIPFATPSQNEISSPWVRLKWRIRFAQFFIALKGQNRLYGHRETRRVRVHVERHSPGELDYGNLVGGCKPLLDAMKHAGLIVDDSPKWIEDTYEQVKCKRGESKTVIRWEPLL